MWSLLPGGSYLPISFLKHESWPPNTMTLRNCLAMGEISFSQRVLKGKVSTTIGFIKLLRVGTFNAVNLKIVLETVQKILSICIKKDFYNSEYLWLILRIEYHFVKSGPSPKTSLCSADIFLNIHVSILYCIDYCDQLMQRIQRNSKGGSFGLCQFQRTKE